MDFTEFSPNFLNFRAIVLLRKCDKIINPHKGISGIKGKVYPVVFVDQSAILDTEFINFEKRPPSGYGQIMFEQNIL